MSERGEEGRKGGGREGTMEGCREEKRKRETGRYDWENHFFCGQREL